MISIWQLIYDLDYWIHIHTADDIVNCPDNRREYQHLVRQCKKANVAVEKIPIKVLGLLKQEADLSWWKRPTFWVCLKLWLFKGIK